VLLVIGGMTDGLGGLQNLYLFIYFILNIISQYIPNFRTKNHIKIKF